MRSECVTSPMPRVTAQVRSCFPVPCLEMLIGSSTRIVTAKGSRCAACACAMMRSLLHGTMSAIGRACQRQVVQFVAEARCLTGIADDRPLIGCDDDRLRLGDAGRFVDESNVVEGVLQATTDLAQMCAKEQRDDASQERTHSELSPV